MRTGWLVALAGVVVVCLALAPASAAPSFRGYTGLVVVPTADTLNNGEFSAGVMTEHVGDFEANDFFGNFAPADNLELGINSFRAVNADNRETLVNAKYRIIPETDQRASVAFGLIDATNEVQSTAYAVFSKSLTNRLSVFDNEITGVRFHGGFGGGQLEGLFLGVSAFVGNRTMASVEWDSEEVHLGFRFTPTRGLRLHAALFDVGGRDKFGLGVSYTRAY